MKTLRIREDKLGVNHIHTALTYINMGSYYNELG